MSILGKITQLITPNPTPRRPGPPPVEVSLGARLPAWVFRIIIFALTLAIGGVGRVTTGQWVLLVVVAVATALNSEAAMGAVVLLTVGLMHSMGAGVSLGWQSIATVALVHLVVILCMLISELPGTTVVQLAVLKRPLLHWLVIQSGACAATGLVWLVASESLQGPWLAMIAGLSICAATLAALWWLRRQERRVDHS